jgi:hypothetical protein
MLHEIDSIEKRMLGLQLYHHNKEVLPYVFVRGIGLFKNLVKAIEENHLHIKVVR